MTKKVNELMTELGVSYQDIKKAADTMGIEVKSERTNLAQKDADRLNDTISKLKGLDSKSDKNNNKPKIKAVPIISKDFAHKPKAPVGKPMPRKAESTDGEVDEVKAKSEVKVTVDKEVKAEVKAENAEAKPKTTKKKTAVKEKPSDEVKESKVANKEKAVASNEDAEKAEGKPNKGEEAAKEPEKKIEKKEESYENAPNKPMRFKKIFDASSAPKEEPKHARKKSSDKDGRKDSKKDERGGRKNDKRDGQSRNSDSKQSRSSSRPQSSAAADAPMADKPQTKGKSKKFFDKDKDKDRDKFKHEKRSEGRNSKSRFFDERNLEKQVKHRKKKAPKVTEPEIEIEELLPEGAVAVTVPITVAGLAEQAEISVSKIIMSLMKLGIMATVNQTLDKDTVEMLGEDLGMQVVVTEEKEEVVEEGLDLREDKENELKPRAPIITVMGHVDHGKTSLLDAIRNTNVTAGESGGITQHIGASEVKINGKKIVFLDTPGHEAFTTMRARGAQVTDIAVLVVAADDSVKPQTIESISHAKAANVPMIVAINKIDKPGANVDRVKKDLADHGVLVEDWGGDVISVPVSAKKGEGITDLLEMILLQAEVLELRANPDRLAMGTVIEARLDKSKGPIATLLVTNGTLKAGQSVVAGTTSGKIRVMTNFKGEAIRKALPATPVEILGLSDVPMAGDSFNAVKDDKVAREIAESRQEKMREDVLAKNASTTLEKLFSQIQEGETKELNLIIKGDVQGSVGAIISSLEKLDTEDVRVNVIHSGVGTVTESDVMLAETSGAIIIGFNVRPTTAVQARADDAEIEIRTYRVIYDIIDDVQNAMKGMLDPEYKEEILGKAEIRETFKVPNIGIIGGAYIVEGKVKRNAQVRLVRDGIVIHEGTISSLRRFKDDAKEVAQGYECGIGIEAYNDIKPMDIIECFHMVEIER
jgi:translation initiation factor IF-2